MVSFLLFGRNSEFMSFSFEFLILVITDKGAAEVESDDGGEEVGIEWGDDEA